MNRRTGLSLLEVILATAILASSAMVLSSLLGLGSKFGGRAEERTEALAQAQSLLDEFLALPATYGDSAGAIEEIEQEQLGLLPGPIPRSYRITVVASPLGSVSGLDLPTSDAVAVPAAGFGGGLALVTVEVFDGAQSTTSESQRPLSRLSQLVRRGRLGGT